MDTAFLSFACALVLQASDGGAKDRFAELAAQVDQEVDGEVAQLSKVGALIDLGGAVGTLRLDQMAWTPPKASNALLKVGQKVKVRVTRVDREKKQVTVSMLRPEGNPWLKVHEKYSIGMKVKGTVEMVMEHGVFFTLAPRFSALVHKSDLPLGKKPPDYTVGQQVELMITNIDQPRERISAAAL
jgi:ribosomal protein S1